MSAGPFVVRHTRLPESEGATGCVLSVWAVGDLAAARSAINDSLWNPHLRRGDQPARALRKQIAALSDEGGTLGPLPDGSLVEVEATTWERLWSEVLAYDTTEMPAPRPPVGEREKAAVLERWNAEHGVGGEA